MLIRFDPNFVQSIQDKEATASESGTVFTVNVDGKSPTLKEFVPLISYCVFDFAKTLSQITGSIDKLSTSIDKNTEALEKLSNLSIQVQDLDAHVQDLDTKVQDQEPRLEKLEKQVEELKELNLKNVNTISKQDGEIRNLQEKMVTIEENSARIDEERLDLERYSRSFNLRISGIKEDNDEKPETSIKKVKEVIKKVTGMEAGLEFAHRIGSKKAGVNRTIIFKLYSRLTVHALINKRKDFFSSKYPLHKDLPKKDLEEKLKYSALMQEKFENKERVAFVRGCWYVNGKKFVPPLD